MITVLDVWINDTRAEVCECGCDANLHDLLKDGTIHCANCTIDCDWTDPIIESS